MLVALAAFSHGHGGKRHGSIQQRLQRRRKSIAVQRKAEQQQVAFQHFSKKGAHIVAVTAGSAVALAGKAAGAVFDVPVDHVDQLHVLRGFPGHSLQKGRVMCRVSLSSRLGLPLKTMIFMVGFFLSFFLFEFFSRLPFQKYT